ncbi:MAG: hypothetical protein ACO29O_07185 [Chitinophagaceae bacterium]
MSAFQYFLIVLPILLGILVVYFFGFLESRGKVIRNVSGSYFNVVAILFALTTTLITTEVWKKLNRINGLMTSQASTARALKRITEPLGEKSALVDSAIGHYLKNLEQRENATYVTKLMSSGDMMNHEFFSGMQFKELYALAADTSVFHGNAAIQKSFYEALEQLRSGWFEREELRKSSVLKNELLISVLFLLGLFTQISIAGAHSGSQRTVAFTVMLFSLAFTASIMLLIILDNPYETSSLINNHVLMDVK